MRPLDLRRVAALVVLGLAVGRMAAGSEEPSPSDAPPCPAYELLLVHADQFGGVEPTVLRNALLAQPEVEVVHLFNAVEGTPTPAQLEAYDIVFTFSNYNDGYEDPATLGDRLADYLDAGGIVVASFYSMSTVENLAIEGRWATDGYSPYLGASTTLTGAVTLGGFGPHPLMKRVKALNAGFRLNALPDPGAQHVAVYSDGSSAVAAKGRAVGLPVYLGNLENAGTGQYARVIVNAGRWLSPQVCP